jgi:pimeloyl-ACP methyl ester carboxylesterase
MTPQLDRETPRIRKAGHPVAFAGCAGFLHLAHSKTGVLMISPWGFEEFTIRAGWRHLAETLADHQFSCLRFDLPGTGDSLGHNNDVVRLDTWTEAVRAAASEFRRLANLENLVVLGQGLGALLAEDLADALGADALISMAPMPEGKAGVRELELWGAMITSTLRIPMDKSASEALNIGGFSLSLQLLEDIKAFKISQQAAGSLRNALVLGRETRPSDAARSAALRRRGIEVTDIEFVGYNAFVSHTETPQTPIAAFEALTDWLVDLFPERWTGEPLRGSDELTVPSLANETAREEAICFGPDEKLFGILCAPKDPKALVIIPNSGYNPHVGWARSHVNLSRRLADAGIATFRMDCASMGDSEATSASPHDVLYSPGQIDDVVSAIDALAPRDIGPIILAGRCSGAYIALHAAEKDARVSGVVSVNALRLIWNPEETLEQAMSGGSSSLDDYRKRAFSREFLLKLLRFELPVIGLAGKLWKKISAKVLVKLVPFTGTMTVRGRLIGKLRQRFAHFEQRGVKTALVYAEGDGGLDELAHYFGPDGNKLVAYSGVALTRVPDADHNMTTVRSQTALYESITETVDRVLA